MAAPLALVARVGLAALGEDLERWALRLAAGVLVALLLVVTLICLLFGSVLIILGSPGSLLGGGQGPVGSAAPGPTTAALAEIPADQLALMQQVAPSSSCHLPWTVLAAIADVESGFGRNMATSSAGAIGYGQFLPGTWAAYGQGRNRYDYHDALPAMARYLCASGAGQDLRGAVFAYNHAHWYVAEVLDRVARYGSVGASGGGLVPGWANAPALDQYDPRNYLSAAIWQQWHALGRAHHRLRLGRQEVRCVGPEPADRVAHPLPRPGRDDLLARREGRGLHLLPAQALRR